MLIGGQPTTSGAGGAAEAGCLGTGMSGYPTVGLYKPVHRLGTMRVCVRVMQYQWVSRPAFPVILADLGENGGENDINPLITLAPTLPAPTIRRLCASAGRLGAPPGAGSGPRGPNRLPKIQKSPVISATCAAVCSKPTPHGRLERRTAPMSAGQGYALRGAA